MDEKKIILVSVSDLVPGMIVARDVYTRNNQMLVPADTKITESIIITKYMLIQVLKKRHLMITAPTQK